MAKRKVAKKQPVKRSGSKKDAKRMGLNLSVLTAWKPNDSELSPKTYFWLAQLVLSLYRLAIAFFCISIGVWLLAVPNWHWAASQFNADTVLKYVTVLVWPLVVVVALAVIRPDVPKILKRGFTFFFPWGGSVEVSAESLPAPAPDSANREALEEASEELQRTDEENSKDVSNTRKSGVTGYVLDVNNQAKLVRHFERASSNMWASHLEALKLLARYQEGLKAEDLQEPYEDYISRVPSQVGHVSFMMFMSFLSSWFFMDYSPKDGIFKISDIGMQFLEYYTNNDLKLTPANAKR